MSAALTLATAVRVLRQIRHDPRTIALLILLPCLLVGLVAWLFDGTPVLDQVGPLLLGMFPLFVMFIVTSVATLRERQSGTLERLMATPLGKGDFVLGYALAFGVLATVQTLVLTGFAVWVCGMNVAGDVWLLLLVAVLNAILGSSLGLAASAVARTEFQAVQMMPALILPQFFLGGLLLPRSEMPAVLEAVSRAFPLTYGIDASQSFAAGGAWMDIRGDVAVIVAFIVGALVIGTATLRRRTA